MSKRFLLTILLLATFLISACGGGGAPNRGDVVVYVAVPLSGFQANGGQTILGGVRLAAAEINNAGGLLGYRVVVRPLDDESDSDVAVSRAAEIQQAIDAGDRVLAVSAADNLCLRLELPTGTGLGYSGRGSTATTTFAFSGENA